MKAAVIILYSATALLLGMGPAAFGITSPAVLAVSVAFWVIMLGSIVAAAVTMPQEAETDGLQRVLDSSAYAVIDTDAGRYVRVDGEFVRVPRV